MDNLFSVQSASEAEDMTAKVLQMQCSRALNNAMENIIIACEAGNNYTTVNGVFSLPQRIYLTKYFQNLGYEVRFDAIGFVLEWDICPTNNYSTEVKKLLNGEKDPE